MYDSPSNAKIVSILNTRGIFDDLTLDRLGGSSKSSFLENIENEAETSAAQFADINDGNEITRFKIENNQLRTQLRQLVVIHRRCKGQYAKIEADMHIKLQRLQELEVERQLYIKELQDREDYISWQEQKIRRLSFQFDSLSEEKRREHQVMQPDQVAEIKERTSLQNRFDGLENELNAYKERNRILLEQLKTETSAKEKMQQAFKKITKNYLESIKVPKTELAEKNSKIEQLENEKRFLAKEIEDCENYIAAQVDEMKKLAYYIDCLSENTRTHQDQRKFKTSTITNYIGETPEVCGEEPCFCKQIEYLEKKVQKYKTSLSSKEKNNRSLRQQLEFEKRSKEKIGEAFIKASERYQELIKKNEAYEDLKCECEKYKTHYEGLEKEKGQCDCYMKNQDEKINEMVCDMKCMAQRHNQKEIHLKNTILNVEEQLSRCEENFDQLQRELENSLCHFSCEKMIMRKRIETLECQINDYESTIPLISGNNKVLLETLENEKVNKAKLQTALEKIMKSDEHLKEMLSEARATIKYITQKLEEYDIERLETQRDNQIKMSELEGQLVLANVTIQKLRENLDQMKVLMDKNMAMRTRAAELHKAANNQLNQLQDNNENLSKRNQKIVEMYDYLKQVLYEKDKTFDDLRNQLLYLKQQLDNEQKLREDTEEELADVTETGKSQINQFKNMVDSLNEEINQLQSELDDIMNTTEVGGLKSHIKKLEAENALLKQEMAKLVGTINSLLPGYIDPGELFRLKSQLTELRSHVKRQAKEIALQRENHVKILQRLRSQQDGLENTVKELLKENVELKHKKPALMVLQKYNKDDGNTEYRLYGGKKRKKPNDPQSSSTEQQSDTASSKYGEDPEQINKLRKQLAVATEDNKKLNTKLSKATEEINGLKAKLRNANEKVAQIENRVIPTSATEEISEPKAKLTNADGKIARLDNSDDRDKLLGQIEDQKREIADLHATIGKFSDSPDAKENEKLRLLITDLEDQLKNTQQITGEKLTVSPDAKENERLRSIIADLEDQLKNTRQTGENLPVSPDAKENERLRSRIADLEDQLKNTRQITGENLPVSPDAQENERLRSRIADLENQLKNTRQITGEKLPVSPDAKENERLRSRIADLEDQLKNTRQITGEKLPVSPDAKENERLRSRIADLEDQLKNIRQITGEKLPVSPDAKENERLRSRIADLEDQLKNTRQITGEKLPVSPDAKENERLRSRIADLEDQLKNTRQITGEKLPVSPDAKEIKNLKSIIADLENQLKNTQQITGGKLSVSPVAKENERPQSMIADVEDQLKNKQQIAVEKVSVPLDPEENKKFKSMIADLEDQLRNIQQIAVETVSVPLDPEENKKMRSMMADLEEQLKNTQQIAVPKASPKINTTTKQHGLEMDQKRISELEELWKKCENNCEKMKNRNEELEKENSELKDNIAALRDKTRLPSASQAYITQLQEVDNSLQNWLTKMDKSVGNLQNDVSALSEAASPLDKATLKKLLQEIDKLKNELSENVTSKKKVVIARDVQEKHIAELENELRQSQENNEALKVELDNLKRAFNTQQSPHQLSFDGEEPIFNRDDELVRLQDKIKDYERKQAEVERLGALRSTLSLEIFEDPQIKELEQTIRQQRDEIEALQKEKLSQARIGKEMITESDKDKPVEQMENFLQQWQKDYETEVGQLKKQIDGLLRRGSLPQGCEAHEGLIKKLQAALEQAQQQNDSLEKKNAQLETENDRLSRILERINSPEGEEDDELEQGRMLDLVDHLRDLQKKNDSLKSKTIQLELDNGRLKNDLGRLMGQDVRSFEKELQRLRDLERQTVGLRQKNQNMKKRLTKVEIENRNLKKEYIDTLIAKEKLKLQSQEQEKRLRETNKLLLKAQDKRRNLTQKMISLQVDNENLTNQVESLMDDEHVRKRHSEFEKINQRQEKKLAEVEAENDYLRQELGKYTEDIIEHAEPSDGGSQVASAESLLPARKDAENLKLKMIKLETENDYMRKELEAMKGKDMLSEASELTVDRHLDNLSKPDQDIRMRLVELEIENEYLKSEIDNKEKMSLATSDTENKITELEEELTKCSALNESLKMKNVDLELDNDYMNKELERITKIQETLAPDLSEKNLEKQNHVLKMKLDSLDVENMKLKHQLENIGKERINLESHTVQKILKEIERLTREYETLRSTPVSRGPSTSKVQTKDDVEGVEERLEKWRQEYEPQLNELKTDLSKLLKNGHEKNQENETECMNKVEKLESEIKNMRIALQILLKDKPSLAHVKLVKEVEELLQRYDEEDNQRRKNMVDLRIAKELEEKLNECEQVNELLRKEEVSLDRHFQDKRIRDLEAELRELQFFDPSRANINRPRGRKSIVLDVQFMRVKELEEELKKLQESKDELKPEVDNLRSGKISLQKELEQSVHNNDELKIEVEKQRKIIELQQNLTTDLNRQLEECRANTENLVGKVTRLSSKERKVSFLNTEQEKIMEDFVNEIKSLKSTLLNVNEKNENLQKRVAELEEQLRKCREVNKFLRNKNHKLENENAAFRNEEPDDEYEEDGADQDTRSNEQENARDEPGKNGQENQEDIEKLLGSRTGMELVTRQLMLQTHFRRTKELNERLRQSHANYRGLKIELERLRKEKLPIQDKLFEKKVAELEQQLRENETKYNEELGRLRREIKSKHQMDKENKNLKDQVNTLVQEKEKQQKEICELQNKVQLLGGGEIDSKNEEMLHVMNGQRIKEMEETLVKYHDSNENLRTQITQLEAEKTSLREELANYITKDRKSVGFEIQARQMRKLVEILQKYRDNSASLKSQIAYFQADSRQAANGEIREQLEGEIQYLKKDVQLLPKPENKPRDIQQKKEPKYSEETSKRRRAELSISSQSADLTSKTPSTNYDEIHFEEPKYKLAHPIKEKLTKPSKKDINLLKQHIQSTVTELLPRQPMMLRSMQPPAFRGMPMLLHPPVLTYGNYFMPPVVANTIEETNETSDDEFQELSDLVNKIQQTLDESRRVLETKVGKKTERPEQIASEIEEKEDRSFDFDQYDTVQSVRSDRGSPTCSNVGSNLRTYINEQLQQRTREKVRQLQNTVSHNLKELKAESLRYKAFLEKTKTPRARTHHGSTHESEPGRCSQCTRVISRCSDSFPTAHLPYFRSASSREKSDPKSSQAPSTSQSTPKRPPGKSFDLF